MKYWTPESFEISSYKWGIEARKNKSYNTSGSDNTTKCTYTYNSLGFRGDEPTAKAYRVMSIGCSHTEGVGVGDNETWSHQLCQLIPGSVDLNFGFGGRSNDYVARCLITYFDLIRPDLVLIMYPNQDRLEYYTEEGNIEPFAYHPWGYFEETNTGIDIHKSLMNIANNENNFVNWYKNHLLITYFLQNRNIPFVWNGSHLFKAPEEANRFDGDYRNFIDFGVDGNHAGPIHNKKYAEKLHAFLVREKFL